MLSDHTRRSAVPATRVTDRSMWVGAYVLTAVAVVARLPYLRGYVEERVGEVSRSQGLADARLQTLAVNAGLFLAVLMALLLVWLYYSLASMIERVVFSGTRAVRARSFGLFFLIAFLLTLPVQLISTALHVTSPKGSHVFYAYVALVAVACPMFFRREMTSLRPSGIAAVWAFSAGFAALSLFL
jgi:hypothetical protein